MHDGTAGYMSACTHKTWDACQTILCDLSICLDSLYDYVIIHAGI